MLFKFRSVWYFSKYHDCKRRTEVLVLFFVFSEDMSSLKVFISSSVNVTIDPGSSSVASSSSCLVELLLAICCAVFAGVFRFLVVASERGFFASPKPCSSARRKEEPPAHFEKRVCLFLSLGKVTMVLKTF